MHGRLITGSMNHTLLSCQLLELWQQKATQHEKHQSINQSKRKTSTLLYRAGGQVRNLSRRTMHIGAANKKST
jgi:hypothetical protein